MEAPDPVEAGDAPGKLSGVFALGLSAAVGLLIACHAGPQLRAAAEFFGLSLTASTRGALVASLTLLAPLIASMAYAIQRWGAEEPLHLRRRMFRSVLGWNALLLLAVLVLTGLPGVLDRIRVGAYWIAEGKTPEVAAPPSPSGAALERARRKASPPHPKLLSGDEEPGSTGSDRPPEPASPLPGLPWAAPGPVVPGTEHAMEQLAWYPTEAREHYERAFRNTQALWPMKKKIRSPTDMSRRWEKVVKQARDTSDRRRDLDILGFYVGFQLLLGETVAQDLDGAAFWFERAGAFKHLARLRCSGGLYDQDAALAASWIREAASQPNASSVGCELDWFQQNERGSCPSSADLEAWALSRSKEGFLPCSFWLRSVMEKFIPEERFAAEHPEHHAHVQELDRSGIRQFYMGASKQVSMARQAVRELVARTWIQPLARGPSSPR